MFVNLVVTKLGNKPVFRLLVVSGGNKRKGNEFIREEKTNEQTISI